MIEFNEAMKAAHDISEEASLVRQETLPVSLQACRALETALKTALAGDPLRGLKNIGTNGVSLYAARVRATSPDQKIPHPSTPGSAGDYLVINHRGDLVTVYWDDDGADSLIETEAGDADLRIDDVAGITQALREVLPRHVKAARATNKRYKEVYALARKLIEVLGK